MKSSLPVMDWLNYHHLLYFWTVAKEGGLRQAAEKLHVSQPSISTQIRRLEETLGVKLFSRQGIRSKDTIAPGNDPCPPRDTER